MLNLLVTGIGGGGVGEQLIKALRLSEHKYTLIGADITPISKGFREVDIACLVPRANDPAYVSSLLEICKKHQIRAIFPGSELEIKALAAQRGAFEQQNILLMINRDDVLDICFDKVKTIDFLKARGFSYPPSFAIRSLEDIEGITDFPFVLKPSVGGGGSMNVLVAQDKEELRLFATFLLKIYPEFVAQQYVGVPEHEYTVGVLFDCHGEYMNAISLRRNLAGALSCRLRVPNTSGDKSLGSHLVISSGISQGEFGPHSEVLEQCTEIAKSLKPTCAVNLQCRLVGGKVFIFEINPRFSGTSSLRAMVGYNEPDVLLRRHLLGESILPNFGYRYAKIVRGLKEEAFFE
jgi:carbamoyl-phosphate synthase large subunit